jgi:arylformamidase
MNAKEIIDISVPLYTGMMVYPGNPEVEVSRVQDIDCGGSSNVSKITLGSHTGTHIDAPSHCVASGASIDMLPLSAFFGPCKVFDATGEEGSVSLEFVQGKDIEEGDRVLFKTKNSLAPFETFRNDFVFLSGEASEYLASKKVSLVGIDFLSIKQKGSSDNRPHLEFLSRNIPILEGVNLKEVAEGEYTLSAFPLKIKNGDGGLTRAVLMKL